MNQESQMSPPISVSMPKRLFILCDGTWQDSVNGKSFYTNITVFGRCLDHISKDGYLQLTYYDSGVGNGTSWLGQIIDGMTGRGISSKIRNAYSFLSRNYNFDSISQDKPDEIVLVGYSRGAFAVQCVASLIDHIGLLEPGQLYFLQGLFNLWANQELKPKSSKHGVSADTSRSLLDERAKHLKEVGALREVKIKALLVWDTVGALGPPVHFTCSHRPLSFVGKEIPGVVENAFHALALDEKRSAFAPQIWQSKQEGTFAKQCWFNGEHADVGGNGRDDLGAVTLLWMIGQVTQRITISFSKHELRKHLTHKYLDWQVKIGWDGYAYDSPRLLVPLPRNSSSVSWVWWVLGLSTRTPHSLCNHDSSRDDSLDVKTSVHITVRMETETNAALGVWDSQKEAWKLSGNEIPECFVRSIKEKPLNRHEDELYWIKVWMRDEKQDEEYWCKFDDQPVESHCLEDDEEDDERRWLAGVENISTTPSHTKKKETLSTMSKHDQFADNVSPGDQKSLRRRKMENEPGSHHVTVEHNVPKRDGTVSQTEPEPNGIKETESEQQAFELIRDGDSAIRLSDFVVNLKALLQKSRD